MGTTGGCPRTRKVALYRYGRATFHSSWTKPSPQSPGAPERTAGSCLVRRVISLGNCGSWILFLPEPALMYEQFFGLQRPPFSMTPDPGTLFLTAQHTEALSGLTY